MAKTFGFNENELKLLVVAVRQMRRTFARASAAQPGVVDHYASLYDALYEKLLDMAAPIPEELRQTLE